MAAPSFDTTHLALVAPFLAALLAPALTRLAGRLAAWLLALVPALLFAHFAGFLLAVAGGEVVLGSVPWVATLDVAFAYRLDGLSLLFALLISGIGALIIVYAGSYLDGHPHLGRFQAFMLAFLGAMQGLVLADDFIMLFVFWELTSLASFLLIAFDHTRRAARRAALQALIVTGAGGLSLLAGLLLTIAATGASSMSEALAEGATLKDHAFYPAILTLVLLAAFTKSAQFPFHFWLPNAMEAPTPVSAYLHSATMVKGGVYLLMRLNPVLGGTEAWGTALPLFGGATLLVGAVLALRQTDLKLILAYTTVASLGLLVLLVGVGTIDSVTGAAGYLLAHSLFKGALFMVAGGIDHGAGARDIRRLGGLGRAMPLTFLAALAAAWSMIGLPLSVGFFGKETIYEALLHAGSGAIALLAAVVLGNAFMVAAALAVAWKPFTGPRPASVEHPHEGAAGLWIGPLALAALGIGLILIAPWTEAHLLAPVVQAVALGQPTIHLSPAIHFNLPLVLSAVTIVLGVLFFFNLARLRLAVSYLLGRIGWGPDRGFDQAITGLTRFSSVATRAVQNGHLERYMTVTLALVPAALIAAMAYFGEWPEGTSAPSLAFHEWAVVLIAVLGLFAVLAARNRLVSIVSLGIQGFAVALIFMLFGAPDLSFTQFMVETLAVVILALVMTRLALHPSDARSGWDKVRDGAIAVASGVAFGSLLVAVTAAPFDGRLSAFFGAVSSEVAHGRNVVNVIIVDFRGVDTLGEITVVMVAGLAILSLLRVRGPRTDYSGEDEA